MAASERRHGRRRFLAGAAGLGLSAAGVALLPGCRNMATGPASLRGELETTRLRVVQTPVMCMAPQYVAGELLRREGFAEVEYIKTTGCRPATRLAVASGQADIGMHFAANVLVQIEAGDPVVILSGVHVGCFELFGTDRIRAIRDLKGRTVATPEVGSGPVPLSRDLAGPRRARSSQRRHLDSARASRSDPAPGRWTDRRLSSASRRTPRSCAPEGSATSSSTAWSTGRGRSTTAAW